jgi:hypothetical protein
MGDSVTALSVIDLQSIPAAEIMKCLTFLGSKPSWNSEQLTAMANLVKSVKLKRFIVFFLLHNYKNVLRATIH